MGATQPLNRELCQPRLRTARAEFDLPEVWPEELDILLQQTDNLEKLLTNLTKPFRQDDC